MTYTPRLSSSGMTSSNTYYKYIYGTTYPNIPLPNCTFYAYSRTMEFSINDYGGLWSNIAHYSNPYWFTGESTYPMACQWYQTAVNSGLWQVGSTPKLGAIACFDETTYHGGGHVAIVEEINADGSVNLSNSDYPNQFHPQGRYFYMANNQFLTVGSTGNYTGEKFQGYIYNPFSSGDTPGPPIPPSGDILIYRRGDWVKIINFGNANSLGTGIRAYGIGWKRQILRVYAKRKYPYQVGLIGKGPNGRDATTGFYQANALRKL